MGTGDTSFEKVAETTTKKRNGSSKDSIPMPTNDTSFERVILSETITNKRGESKRLSANSSKDSNAVITGDTSFERTKLSETSTKKRGETKRLNTKQEMNPVPTND